MPEDDVAVKDYNLNQPMDKLIDIAVRKFGEVEFQEIAVGQVKLQLLQIKKMQQYIDKLMDRTRAGKMVALPLWAKIWPSSVVMGYSLSKFPLAEGGKVLEIGGGTAVNGLVLASRGFSVTVVDNDPDSVLFSRINALRNGLDGRISAARSDFSAPMDEKFDCIVGCEMLYDEKTFYALPDFVDGSLVEGETGEAFFSLDLKKVAKPFFEISSTRFNIMRSVSTYKDQESKKETEINLFRFKRK